ncbi:MAG: alpha/beta fold hydrolase [Gemmatimonadaceae bacterium]
MIGVALVMGLGFVGAATLALWWGQERLVFQPTPPPYPSVTSRRIDYHADDGQPLFAYVVKPASAGAPQRTTVMIAFHGNADLAAARVPWAEEVAARTGVTVLLPEWRGYAGLTGRPTAAGVERDAQAALRIATDSLGATPAQLAIYGHSLGSAIATELTAHVHPGVLVLESPFTSARDMARIIVARPVEMVWGMISRVHYDTRERVMHLDVPVWIAHGERDFVIPVRMGQQLFAAARVKGELLLVPAAGHNDIAEASGTEYWTWIERALRGLGS